MLSQEKSGNPATETFAATNYQKFKILSYAQTFLFSHNLFGQSLPTLLDSDRRF
jgi:hypothetical protein